MDDAVEVALVLFSLAIFSVGSHKTGSLDRDGILVGNVIGIATYLLGRIIGLGIVSFFVILFFFVVAETATRIGRRRTGEKHETRTTGNILGNSTAAIISLLAGSPVAFFGAMSAALSDTLSSEIGLLSKKKPVLITTFREVKPGTDGGVTSLGLAAALFGGTLIGLIYYYFYGNPAMLVALIIAGFSGSLVDSVLGATFERKNLLTNTQVNFLGSGSGAVLAYLFFMLL